MPVDNRNAADLIATIKAAFEDDRPAAGPTARPAARIAVAVSGGSDSMAALHLAWQAFGAVQAVTVDHLLRDGSAAEARAVTDFCDGLGAAHHVLRWEHGAVPGNLMDAARRARYGLMADWAEQAGISHIILGHTADDQAETFLMGLARSAGLDGLTGMRRGWTQGAVRFVRPLLSVERGALRGYLQGQGIGWIDDPSNENNRFTRVKTRQILTDLKPLGITVDRLSGVVRNLVAAQGVVQRAVAQAAGRVSDDTNGELRFDLKEWHECDAEVQRRLLLLAMLWVSGADYPPRADAVARVLAAIADGCDATLWGVRLRAGKTSFRLMREARAVAGVTCRAGQLWDGRWQVTGPFSDGYQLRALGAEGLRQCDGWRQTGHARESLVVSPAVWYDQVLIAAPMAGFPAGFNARIVAGFNQFVLSH